MNINNIYKLNLRKIIKWSFPFWQKLGFHITANHFFEPIPDTRKLRDALWMNHSELIGININEERQLDLLSTFVHKYKNEYSSIPQNRTTLPYQYYINNGYFSSVDGEILFCMIRYFKPVRVFEIGSGNSTFLAAQAILKNKLESNHSCELVAFDPYPNRFITSGLPGLSRLVKKGIEDVPISEFSLLEENDILFIDSSHVLRIGNDVQRAYLEILPRLNKGVLIHIHDIFFPSEYPKDWVIKKRNFFVEQYLLQAFLSFNERFEVLWAGSYMHIKHPDLLESAFSSYSRNVSWPASFWLRRKH